MASAAEFVRRNDVSPAIAGKTIGRGGQGADFTFADGTVLRLTAAQLCALPKGYPRWSRSGPQR